MSIEIVTRHLDAWMQMVPRTHAVGHLHEAGLQAVMFESVPCQGRATRVFAWIGMPEGATPGHPAPGMILIHGGGGTAFARWVRIWNARGYAAIAMDTCGAIPLPDTGAPGPASWPRHSFSGPPGWGGFDQCDRPPEDQWAFHAAAAIVKAHTLLAAQPGVDPGRIGATGISWGGFLACLAAGLDPRLRCVMPVYGCGSILESPAWADTLARNPDLLGFWRETWDPAAWLPRARCPMLWLNGTNDFAFTPPIWQRSAASTGGPRQLCLKVRWPHGHMPAAESARELFAFADACLLNGTPLISLAPPVLADGVLSAAYGPERKLRAARLLATPDSGGWPEREWFVLPAGTDPERRMVSARLPDGATAACLSLVSEDWLTSTSDVVFPPSGAIY